MKFLQKMGVGLLTLVSFASLAVAQAPRTLNYQGVIFDDAGAPITTPLTLRFSLWKGPDYLSTNITGGEIATSHSDFADFSEVQTITPDGSGNFVTSIGIVEDLPAIDPSIHRYLQVEVKQPNEPNTEFRLLDVDGEDNSIDRRFLGATPYALFAETLEGRGVGSEAGEIPFLDDDAKLSSDVLPEVDAAKIKLFLEDFESDNLIEALSWMKTMILDNEQSSKNNRNSVGEALQEIAGLSAADISLNSEEFESENVNAALVWLKHTIGDLVGRVDNFGAEVVSEKIITNEVQLGSDEIFIGDSDTLNPNGEQNGGLLIRSNQTVEVNINGNDSPPDMFVVTSGSERRELFRVEDDGKIRAGDLLFPNAKGLAGQILAADEMGDAVWADQRSQSAKEITLSDPEFVSTNVRDALVGLKSAIDEISDEIAEQAAAFVGQFDLIREEIAESDSELEEKIDFLADVQISDVADLREEIAAIDVSDDQTAAEVPFESDEFQSENVAAALEGLKAMILEDRATIAALEEQVLALGGQLDDTSEVPSGTISTFNRSECPEGWSEVFGNIFGNGNGWFNGQSHRSIVICQKN